MAPGLAGGYLPFPVFKSQCASQLFVDVSSKPRAELGSRTMEYFPREPSQVKRFSNRFQTARGDIVGVDRCATATSEHKVLAGTVFRAMFQLQESRMQQFGDLHDPLPAAIHGAE